MIKRLAWLGLVGLLVLMAALTFNTWRQRSRQLQVTPVAPLVLDEAGAAQRLAATLRFVTISSAEQPAAQAAEFDKLHDYLAHTYPRLHATLKRETVGGHALLYTWAGSDALAPPVLWMAHQDVVPVAPGTEADWQQHPFDGVVKDGYIWGRGAWDDKSNLCAQMEAIETLLARGFRPRQTLYLAYGDDEEVGGARGAQAIAAVLKGRAVRLGYVLDEGMLVTEGILKGIDRPVALVGVAEKGYATFQLALSMAPGHSSMPPRQSAIGMMSAALVRLEQQQFPAEISGVARAMFDAVAPEMNGVNRVALSNLWLFAPLLRAELEKSPSTNALIRSTTALTVIDAGNKDNVLPGRVTATVNLRLLPGTSGAQALAHVRRVLANEAITVTPGPGNSEPSRVTRSDTPAYRLLNQTIRQTFPTAVVAPGLMLGATDSRHFEALTDNVFKFSPVRAGLDDLARFHGTNERLASAGYADMIRFYHQLIINGAAP